MNLRYFLKGFYLGLAILALVFNFVYAKEAQFCGEIKAKNINVRLDATTTAAVLAVLEKGEWVEVVLERYDWYKIRLPKSLPVYIKKNLADCTKYTKDSSLLSTGSAIKQCLSAKVSANRVNIRAKPSESAPIVGIAAKDEIVNIISEPGDWYKIKPTQNSFGWVHKKFIHKVSPLASPSNTSQLTQDIISALEAPESNAVFTGIVMPYGVVLMRQATHKLVTADNKIFLLKGNRASLNSLNRKKVKVVGKIISPAQAKYPLLEIKIIEALS